MKISDAFEGKNSSLKRTFDNAVAPNFIGKPSKKTLREVEIEYLLHTLYKYRILQGDTPKEARKEMEKSKNLISKKIKLI